MNHYPNILELCELTSHKGLYDADADLVLSSSDHHYERFAPQNHDGVKDTARGLRQFVAGTGGKSL